MEDVTNDKINKIEENTIKIGQETEDKELLQKNNKLI